MKEREIQISSGEDIYLSLNSLHNVHPSRWPLPQAPTCGSPTFGLATSVAALQDRMHSFPAPQEV